MIYLAPIQGFTDYIYRQAFAEIFTGVDTFSIPYITLKNGDLIQKYEKEILPVNNPQARVIPQVLANNGQELFRLSQRLSELGYTALNLNLGCPYPMVTNRKKGAGLLPFPGELRSMLSYFFEHSNLQLSVKMRAGLNQSNEAEKIIAVLNEFPVTEIIFHPRVAKQLYKGEIQKEAFIIANKRSRVPLIYNGDIFSKTDFIQKQLDFEGTHTWMLGRGVLMNPFLPAEIKGSHFSTEEKRKKQIEFHERIFTGYSEKMDNQGNVLNKMKQFWSYFCYGFPNPQKTFKTIKKLSSAGEYLAGVKRILSQ